MKNIILQHFDGNLRELDKLSIENIKNYSIHVGAEYQLITGKPFRPHLTPPCQKVIAIDERFDSYDNVVMLDIDMFAPRRIKHNIFEVTGIGVYSEIQKLLHNKLVERYKKISSLSAPYWGGSIYKFTKEQRIQLRNHLGNDESWMNNYNKPYNYEDEGIFHTLATKTNLDCKNTYLDKMWSTCSYLPTVQEAGFIHIRTKITPTGPKRDKLTNYKELVKKNII